jgi:hypothetical protein
MASPPKPWERAGAGAGAGAATGMFSVDSTFFSIAGRAKVDD